MLHFYIHPVRWDKMEIWNSVMKSACVMIISSSQVYCLLYELKGNAEYTCLQSAGGWWHARGTGRLLNDHLEQSARWTLHQTPRQTPFTGILIISSTRTCSAHNAAKHTTQDDGRHWLGTLVRHNAAQQICQSVPSQCPVSGRTGAPTCIFYCFGV